MPQNIRNPKPKKFFSLQTQRLAKSFEGMNSFLAQSAKELCCCQDTWKLLVPC